MKFFLLTVAVLATLQLALEYRRAGQLEAALVAARDEIAVLTIRIDAAEQDHGDDVQVLQQ